MQCKRCYSHMQLVKRENHQDSFLEWHKCPACSRMEFISEPVQYSIDVSGKLVMPMVGQSFRAAT